MPKVTRDFAVPEKGIGRKDYSINVETSVEPMIRSWEEQYTHCQEWVDVEAGESNTENIVLPTDYVYILYDFTLSTLANTLIGLEAHAVGADEIVAPIFEDTKYQRIYHPIPRGFPFFHIIRIVVKNLGDETLDSLVLSLAGIKTAESAYYLTVD